VSQPQTQTQPQPRSMRRSLAVLAFPALIFSLSQTAVIPALGEMARDLHTTPSAVAWTLSGNLVASAVLTPVLGRLGDMLGRRRILVLSLSLFALGSVVSAAGPTIAVVVLGRIIQGGGGGIFPLCFGLARDQFPPEKVPSSIGLISALTGIGGGVGLIVGGVFTDQLSFRWIFGTNAVLAALGALAAHRLLPTVHTRESGRVDVRGAIVLGIGLSCPLIAISKANDWGWSSPKTLCMIAFGLIVLALWVGLEQHTPSPLVHIPTLARPQVLVSNLSTMLVGFAMFGSFVLTPQLLQSPKSTGYGFGLTATQSGLLMVPGAIVGLVFGPLSGVIGKRLGAKVPMALGCVISAIGLGLTSVMHGSIWQFLLFVGISNCGTGMAFAAMPNLIVEAVPLEMTGQATGVNALVRSVGSSVGSQLIAALLASGIVAGAVYPIGSAYTKAFAIAGGVALAAAIAGALIPRRGSAAQSTPLDVLSELGAAASELGTPALSNERF
jgi:MFS family permease